MGWFDLAGAQSGWVTRGDALDQDCNGADTDDADSDGYIAESCGTRLPTCTASGGR